MPRPRRRQLRYRPAAHARRMQAADMPPTDADRRLLAKLLAE